MWDIDFISEDDFTKHVQATIKKYGDKLNPINLKKFNSNYIDPIKLIFDKTVYRSTWDEIIKNEIFRQRDKSNNNDIGYFHQNIFSYMKDCIVPKEGWDVIYKGESGIALSCGQIVGTVYVEMKNKHNTMNSASSARTYMKMQNQLLKDDDCACFLVEIIAKQSQDVEWKTSIDKSKVNHRLIRRVSIDQFYTMVTGQEDAFYKICMALPGVVQQVVDTAGDSIVPDDTVLKELQKKARSLHVESEDMAFAMAIFMLGFSSYKGF